jgi:hypothetical protein
MDVTAIHTGSNLKHFGAKLHLVSDMNDVAKQEVILVIEPSTRM